jgi:hypothetical protein
VGRLDWRGKKTIKKNEKVKMLKFGITIAVTLVVVYIVYENIALKKQVLDRRCQYGTIFLEDVISRTEEAKTTKDPLTAYRKLREAHAALEVLAAATGGYQALSAIIELNVEDFDDSIRALEKKYFEALPLPPRKRD